MNNEDLARLAAAMRSRSNQVRMRIGLAIVIAPAFSGFTDWPFALGWLVAYGVLQLAERAMFPVDRLEAAVARRGGASRAVAIVFLNNIVFSSFSAVGMATGDTWGAACAALLISGAVLNTVLTASGSRLLFYAGLAPQVGYFVLLVAMVSRAGAGVEIAAMIAFAASLNIVAALFTWRLFSQVLDAERLARSEAEAANKAKSDFLANISHEVRTPLNGVLGIASVLSRTPLSVQQLDYVKTVETSALTLQILLTDILDLSKIEAGAVDLAARPFDLEQVVCDVGKLFEEPAREKGLAFRVEIAPSARVWLEGDRTRIAQILTNLCSNAVKFTMKGSVTVRASIQGRLVLEVADTGIGLSEEARLKVFDRFSQADSSISRLYGGTGLGLAISQSLAELMDGLISVRSTPGEGSTFRFEALLPQAVPQAGESALMCHEAEPAEAGEGPLRILLAEDHPVNRKVVEAILASVADVASVCDGRAAVEAAGAAPYDLILMDMQMPVMDGLAATRAIREAELAAHRPRTPIIMLTANVMREHELAATAAGADLHLAKPITTEALLAAVMRALSLGGVEEAA